MKARDFDKKFDVGEDVTRHLDLSRAHVSYAPIGCHKTSLELDSIKRFPYDQKICGPSSPVP